MTTKAVLGKITRKNAEKTRLNGKGLQLARRTCRPVATRARPRCWAFDRVAMISGPMAIGTPLSTPSKVAGRPARVRAPRPVSSAVCQISTRRDVEARAPGGRRLRCAGARTTRVSITDHRCDRVRVGAASIPIGGASSSDADPTAEDDVGTPAPKDDATLTDLAPEPKSKFLRSIGVTNGIYLGKWTIPNAAGATGGLVAPGGVVTQIASLVSVSSGASNDASTPLLSLIHI